MRILFFFFILIQAHFVGANENCAPVRMDQDGGPLEGVPAQDQVHENICFLHTGSLMMTAQIQARTHQRPPHIVAPEKAWSTLMALPKSEAAKLLSATKGRTCEAINLMKTVGTCDRAKLLDLLNRFADTKWFGDKDPQKNLSNFKDAVIKLYRKNQDKPQAAFCQDVSKGLQKLGLSESEIEGVMRISQESVLQSPEHLFDFVLGSACQKDGGWQGPIASTVDDPPVCKKFDFVPDEKNSNLQDLQPPDAFKAKIHALLDEPSDSRMPIGIEYCSGVLKKSREIYITNRKLPTDIDFLNDPKQQSRNLSDNCKFHASAVIGRMPINGKCHFLIQNSWGSSCNYYENPKNCENGKVWISEDDLSRNILRVSHF